MGKNERDLCVDCKANQLRNNVLWQMVKINDQKMARYYFKLANSGIDNFTTYQEKY